MLTKRIHCNIDQDLYNKLRSTTKNNPNLNQEEIVNRALRRYYYENQFKDIENKIEELIKMNDEVIVKNNSVNEINDSLLEIIKELKKMLKKT